jgi:hypothetical protein
MEGEDLDIVGDMGLGRNPIRGKSIRKIQGVKSQWDSDGKVLE